MKLNKIFSEFLLECSSNCKKSTIDRYLYVYNKYIFQYFDSYEIENISVNDINFWKLELNKTKLSFESKKKLYFTFSSIFNFAYRVYGINNIFHRCKCFRKSKPDKEQEFYSLEEFKKYESVISNIEHKLFFNMLFYLGLRRGEALALCWGDINKNDLEINKSKRKGIISTPKTIYSFRIIKIPSNIMILLKAYLISKKNVPKKADPIFNLSETGISRYNSIYAKKANLKKIRIHYFRHSNITFLCSLGIPFPSIAKNVGHKNIKEIIEVYLHSNKNYSTEILNILEKEINIKN